MAVKHTPGVGAPPSGIAQIAGSVGKPSRQQAMTPGVTPAITGGNAASSLMNHYGKAPPPGMADTGMPGTTGVSPTSHAGVSQIRGGKGGMKRNPRNGGIGPGPMATAGGDNNYDATSQDTE